MNGMNKWVLYLTCAGGWSPSACCQKERKWIFLCVFSEHLISEKVIVHSLDS